MRIPFAIACLLVACTGAAIAGTPRHPVPTPATAATPSSITTLATITVTGVVPGPGLWKVEHGDHVLWILGVVPTVPTGIQWQSAGVERIIAGSQAVLAVPDVVLDVHANWLSKLFLVLPAYNAQRNPDGKTLADVLPPPLYARWQVQKQHYFGDDDKVERYRPIVAALKLRKQALKQHGLRSSGRIEDTITALATQHQVPIVKSDTTLEIRHPHQALKAFREHAPDGVACFDQVLGVVEYGLPVIRARANAWATGDIDALRALKGTDYVRTCESAIVNAGFARELGIDNLPREVEDRWLDAAEAALATHAQSFAVLPMAELLDPHGYLAALAARGYTITAPDAVAGTDSGATPAPAATSSIPPAK